MRLITEQLDKKEALITAVVFILHAQGRVLCSNPVKSSMRDMLLSSGITLQEMFVFRTASRDVFDRQNVQSSTHTMLKLMIHVGHK